MKSRTYAVGLFAGLCFAVNFTAAESRPTSDAEIKQAIIQDSIANYPGPCACPYNVDRRGHSCGRRSAYSKPGGYAPICYEQDVTPEMVRRYRRSR